MDFQNRHRYEGFRPISYVDWGDSSRELRVELHEVHPGRSFGSYEVSSLAPVIERSPFGDRLLVEVVADPCRELRQGASLDTAVRACLPEGAVVETEDFSSWPSPRIHIPTDDGLAGWASADRFRWHSDGVRLADETVR